MRETPQERYFRKKNLPKDLAEESFVSFNLKDYLSIIHKNLSVIYGAGADWQENIQKYKRSSDLIVAFREIDSVDNLYELSKDDILNWINDEIHFSGNAERLINLIPSINSRNKDLRIEAVNEAGDILGLFGKRKSSLYHYLIDFDLSANKGKELANCIITNYNNFEIAVKTLIRLFIPGKLLTLPVLGTAMTQQKQRFFYRGENAYYGCSKPSAFRKTDPKEPNHITKLINLLRFDEGLIPLEAIASLNAWFYSTVEWMAMAQHYGMKTYMMDITSDVIAALFFATCTYENGKWRPLRKEEFESADSRKSIFERGGDSRYAVIYRKPSEIANMQWLYTNGEDIENRIFPVGHQPFMRCSHQHAYGFITRDPDYDLYRDTSFEKYRIRLTEDLCNWVFEQAHRGEDIYPNNDVPLIEAYFRRINSTNEFSRGVFESLPLLNGCSKDEKQSIEIELKKYGYSISETDLCFLSQEEIEEINRVYPPERVKELTSAEPVADPIIVIPPNIEQTKLEHKKEDEDDCFLLY